MPVSFTEGWLYDNIPLYRYRANDGRPRHQIQYDAPSPASAVRSGPGPAVDCGQCTLSCGQWSPAGSGDNIAIYLCICMTFSNKYAKMSKQERVKGRFKTHVCETNDCACYQCSACDRRIVYKPAFVKHQLFSDCTPHLTPELRASDLAREYRQRVQVPNPGDSDGCAGVTGDSDPNCDSGEGSGGRGTAPAQHQGSHILASSYWLSSASWYDF